MFCRYVLRTTDAQAGRQFYADAIGLKLPDGSEEGSVLEAWPLHEHARVRGVPSHWLGHLAVDDVEAFAARMVALGGDRLGPTVQTGEGVRFATVRDPLGDVIALRQSGPRAADRPVAWHQLHTRDAERATRLYCELFGWSQVGTEVGTEAARDAGAGHRLLACARGQAPLASIADTARDPRVHAHWLFHFPVDDIDAATARVRALGGTAFDPIPCWNGLRITACEDPQGAAFGLVSEARAATS